MQSGQASRIVKKMAGPDLHSGFVRGAVSR